jgi:aspartate 4-decarboxylase
MPTDDRLGERFADLSPYLLRDLLVGHARLSRGHDEPLRDATAEAPNWQQRDVQLAWHVLGLYCDYTYGVVGDPGNVRLLPTDAPVDHEAAFNRFAEGLMDLREGLAVGTDFLSEFWPALAGKILTGRTESELIALFTRAMSNSPYPPAASYDFVPPLVLRYLTPRLFAGNEGLAGQFQVQVTPGASGGLVQLAHTLSRNALLGSGDRVAILPPADWPTRNLFARQLGCEVVLPPAADLAALADPAVKLVCVQSPGHPLPPAALRQALEPVLARRPDLLVIADFSAVNRLAEPQPSLLEAWPRQVVGLYSFSRDFGLAGARLGVVLAHRESLADRLLRQLPAATREQREAAYAGRLPQPAVAGLLERMREEGSGVAYGHVGPVPAADQVLLALCAAYEVVAGPVARTYFAWMREELVRRHRALHRGLGLPWNEPMEGDALPEAALVPLRALVPGLPKEASPWLLLFHLAHRHGTVVMPGAPFGFGSWTVRLPLAALGEGQCEQLGRTLAVAMAEVASGEECRKCRELVDWLGQNITSE